MLVFSNLFYQRFGQSYVLFLLNIKDKNIKLTQNFYKKEKIEGIDYKIVDAILSYEQAFCPRCGCIFNNKQTYEKNGFKSSDILMLDVAIMVLY